MKDVFRLPRELVGEDDPLVVFKVVGDSMIGAAIADGDWVVVRPQPPHEMTTCEMAKLSFSDMDAHDDEDVHAQIGGPSALIPTTRHTRQPPEIRPASLAMSYRLAQVRSAAIPAPLPDGKAVRGEPSPRGQRRPRPWPPCKHA